ncbi:unnamed protein product [Prorocentrum cordatum]|uniref:Uncharacterized protein n=1 Tax=Prorocentrum cordatum TaxID=2364126 RepID=A0ABN9WBQ2_9DINO|nr:unnamed protein product [Polarella glacialis]
MQGAPPPGGVPLLPFGAPGLPGLGAPMLGAAAPMQMAGIDPSTAQALLLLQQTQQQQLIQQHQQAMLPQAQHAIGMLASQYTLQAAQAYDQSVSQTIDPEITELAHKFKLDERITRDLDVQMKKRQGTFEDDMKALWEILEGARNPAGLLRVKIREMEEGAFRGTATPDREVEDLAKKFSLDAQAAAKLAEVLSKRDNRSKDLRQIAKHLELSNKPSSLVMLMLKVWWDRAEWEGELQKHPHEGGTVAEPLDFGAYLSDHEEHIAERAPLPVDHETRRAAAQDKQDMRRSCRKSKKRRADPKWGVLVELIWTALDPGVNHERPGALSRGVSLLDGSYGGANAFASTRLRDTAHPIAGGFHDLAINALMGDSSKLHTMRQGDQGMAGEKRRSCDAMRVARRLRGISWGLGTRDRIERAVFIAFALGAGTSPGLLQSVKKSTGGFPNVSLTWPCSCEALQNGDGSPKGGAPGVGQPQSAFEQIIQGTVTVLPPTPVMDERCRTPSPALMCQQISSQLMTAVSYLMCQ